MEYDNILQSLKTLSLGNELVIRESTSNKDLNTCDGVATADDKTNTCVKCVAANRTVYRNSNKCEYKHPNCKCSYRFYAGSLSVKFDIRKIKEYLFVNVNKAKMMRSMGYYFEDSDELYHLINDVVKNAYGSGDYELNYLNEMGQHAQINFTLAGKRDHSGELFACHTGCVFLPYGVIKVATPFILED